MYRGSKEEFESTKSDLERMLQKYVIRSVRNLRYEIKMRGTLLYVCVIENVIVPELVEEVELAKEDVKELKEDMKKVKDKVKIEDDPEPTP